MSKKDKSYWFIDDVGRIQHSSPLLDKLQDRPNNFFIRKAIGNYFESYEEAQKIFDELVDKYGEKNCVIRWYKSWIKL